MSSHAHSESASLLPHVGLAPHLQAMPIRNPLRFFLMSGSRLIFKPCHSESASLLPHVGLAPLFPSRAHSESASLLPHVGLAPYKKAIINAVTNKFARRYYCFFARLVAYAKYLFNNPSKAFPCLASSLAIS